MVYTFVITIVCLNLNFNFNILNAITTKYRILANKSSNFWKLSLVIYDFIKILAIWASFSYKLFSSEKIS